MFVIDGVEEYKALIKTITNIVISSQAASCHFWSSYYREQAKVKRHYPEQAAS